jgi:hypothetical protein
VDAMTNSASVTYLTRQFDDFLFARINDASEATPLSVLSMLARLDIDPWEEAAKLARLPQSAAAKRLVDLIVATPGASSAYINDSALSDRLIKLLPSPAAAVNLTRQETVARVLKMPGLFTLAIIVAVAMTIALMIR